MLAWRPGMQAAAWEEFGCDASSSTTGGPSILRPAELRTEPSFGSSSKTGASEVRVALVNPFLKLRQRRPRSRTDQVAEIASLARVNWLGGAPACAKQNGRVRIKVASHSAVV